MVVDPKPMVGDPAYDLWPMASQLGQPFRAADPAAALAENLRVIADAAEVDFSRAARWARARTGLNVSWFLAEGDTQRAAAEATALMAWSEVVGS
jgi:streptomycin 6-kinase